MNETPLPIQCPRCGCPEKNISETHWLCGTHIATAGRPIYACYDAQIQNLERELTAAKESIKFWGNRYKGLSELHGKQKAQLSAATAACAAKDTALEFVVKYVGNLLDWPGNVSDAVEGITVRCASALSNSAGQDILAELRVVRETCDKQSKIIMECANARDEWKAAWCSLNDDTRLAINSQSARIAELVGALKPFDISEAHLSSFEDTNNFTISRTAGQFRAVTKALAAKGGEPSLAEPITQP